MTAQALHVRLPGRVVSVRPAGAPVPDEASRQRDLRAAMLEARLEEAQRQAADAHGEMLSLRRALADGLAQIDRLHQRIVAEAEQQVVELALAIARKVLMQDVSASTCDIEPIVRQALSHAPPRREVHVHLNPEDWQRCRMVRDSGEAGEAGKIRFVADPSVPCASCVLETSEGIVESSVEKNFSAVAEALRSAG